MTDEAEDSDDVEDLDLEGLRAKVVELEETVEKMADRLLGVLDMLFEQFKCQGEKLKELDARVCRIQFRALGL